MTTDIEISDLSASPNNYIKYYPNFDINSTLKITLNVNEYFILTKFLMRSYINNNQDIFYKLDYTNTDDGIEFTKFYNKGSILNIKKYKIVLE